MNHCVLSAAGADNDYANSNNIIFVIKGTKWYVPVVTLLAKGNKKLSKLLSKGFERSMYWSEYKTKSENKNKTNEHRYFLKSKFVGVNRLFVLVHSNRDVNAIKGIKLGDIIYQNVLLKIITPSSMERTYGEPIDSDIKRYKKIKKLTAGQSEDYTTGCLLDYGYIKNHCRLIAVDLSRQKELDADQKAI